MQSTQPPEPLTRFTLDVVTGIDVVVGWRLNVVNRPGRMPTQDSHYVPDADSIYALVQKEYAALLASPQYNSEIKEVIVAAAINIYAEIGREFHIDDFTYFIHSYVECNECQDKIQCPKCHKSGYITRICQAYLVASCVETDMPGSFSTMVPPSAQAAPLAVPSPSALVTAEPAPRRPTRLKSWYWTVPLAALATVVMAVAIGLRLMSPAEVAKLVPEDNFREGSALSGLSEPPISLPSPNETVPVTPPTQIAAVAPSPTTAEPAAADTLALPSEDDEPAPPIPMRKPVGLAAPPTVAAAPQPVPHVAPPTPAMAAPIAPPTAVPVAAKAKPAGRVQSALAQLGLYHGPITGEMDDQTRRALTAFLARVPPVIRAKYGTAVAAMTEAAARHEFALKAP